MNLGLSRGKRTMKRGFVWTIAGTLALGSTLTACLVQHDTVKSYTISLPAKWPVFKDGHYIEFLYDIYLADGLPQKTTGLVKWTWEQSYQLEPFTGTTITPIFRFSVLERLGDGEKKSVQYVTQDTDGNMFLHATEGIGSTLNAVRQNSYWATPETTLIKPMQPSPLQLLWSPIDTGTSNIIGEEKATGTTYLVGPCDSATCPTAVTITMEQLRINKNDLTGAAIEDVETPLGKFQAYRLDYTGKFLIDASVTVVPPNFDYRMSCWTPGVSGLVTFNGSIWIYPSIGPVQLENSCIFGGHGTYYSARASKTNLPH